MSLLRNRLFQITTAMVLVLFLVAFLLLVLSDNGEETDNHTTQTARTGPEGFTFLDIGADTAFTKSIRKKLEDALGPGSIEKRTTIDLSINYKGFLQEHFEELYQLNKELNYNPRERIEHNTLKLSYRYARRKNKPFEYVGLVFSNFTRKPLFFQMRLKAEGLEIIDKIKEKYDQGHTIDWHEKGGTSLYWRKSDSILIASTTTDRLGNLKYHIMLYYLGSIRELLEAERKEGQKREDERKRAAETAF